MTPIPYGRQNITQEDIDAVVETFKSDFLTQGFEIAAFDFFFFAEYIVYRLILDLIIKTLFIKRMIFHSRKNIMSVV